MPSTKSPRERLLARPEIKTAWAEALKERQALWNVIDSTIDERNTAQTIARLEHELRYADEAKAKEISARLSDYKTNGDTIRRGAEMKASIVATQAVKPAAKTLLTLGLAGAHVEKSSDTQEVKALYESFGMPMEANSIVRRWDAIAKSFSDLLKDFDEPMTQFALSAPNKGAFQSTFTLFE